MKGNFLALVIVFFFQFPACAVESGSITIEISDLRNDKGTLRLEVFNDEKKFDAMKYVDSGALKSAVIPIHSGHAHTVISGLPDGDYAVRFFHDEDNSTKFYTNMLGMPKVEYGFSNNAKGHFGPAKYKDAKFSMRSEEKHLDLVAIH